MSNNTGGSIYGDNNASNVGGSIGEYVGTAPVAPTAAGVTALLPTNGVSTVFPLTTGMGTLNTVESVYNPLTGAEYPTTAYTVAHTNANVTTFTFLVAPAAGAAQATVVGVP